MFPLRSFSEGTQQMLSGLALPTFLRDPMVCDDKQLHGFPISSNYLSKADWAGSLTAMAQAHQVAACEEAQGPQRRVPGSSLSPTSAAS